jgi:O-acetyl-ADP-ribose deacetylase (regulator of RNase III)
VNGQLTYTKGDATLPVGFGNKVIVHICNDVGGWGKGFVLAISKRWKEPELDYRRWYETQQHFALGEVRLVQVEPEIWVANLIGQHRLNKDEQGNPPIRYDAVASGLLTVGRFAMNKRASVHMPRIGCGLAGGTWDKIEPLIVEGLTQHGVDVIVYDF